jgi:hypothetical protein
VSLADSHSNAEQTLPPDEWTEVFVGRWPDHESVLRLLNTAGFEPVMLDADGFPFSGPPNAMSYEWVGHILVPSERADGARLAVVRWETERAERRSKLARAFSRQLGLGIFVFLALGVATWLLGLGPFFTLFGGWIAFPLMALLVCGLWLAARNRMVQYTDDDDTEGSGTGQSEGR